ncbi:MAG: nucleotidyltransferase family protein [Oscillospiraceae bacterium]|nr:nucleotidyltransferase family protein [Oscillospiraceae bacterium]
MKTYGIISEYNPFHNGHIRHIEATRKHGATHIAAIMSGGFVQRGDVAVIDKFRRAKIAVNNGVDLVVELPAVYSLATAELFARAGVLMLGALGADGISFGSECGDTELLKKASEAAVNALLSEKLKPLMEKGASYPAALQKTVAGECGSLIAGVFDFPNNTLGVEYLKALKFLDLNMEAFTVKRVGAMHDGYDTSGNIAGGLNIRNMIKNGGDFAPFVPPDTLRAIEEYTQSGSLAYFSNLERALLYRLRTCTPKEVAETPDVGQGGLHNRVFEMGRVANSLGEYFEAVGTKRYTAARIRRILLNLFIGIKNTDLLTPPPFGRVLALNEKGAQILKKAAANKEDNKYALPFMSAMKNLLNLNIPAVSRYAEISSRATDLYGLALKNIAPCALDFTSRIEIL